MFRFRGSLASLSLLIVCVGCLSTPLLQAGAKFQGGTGYQVTPDGSSVTIKADEIKNMSSSDATGTLLLKLWAFDAPYQGKNENGTLLGTYKLEGLKPGNHYTSINQTVPLTRPNVKKNYVISLTLSEFQKGGYVTVDWRNMPKSRGAGAFAAF